MRDYPRNDFERWLKNEFGFERENPFATASADQEKEFLAEELFVPVDAYDRIRGDETLLIFAPQGGGKSALRVRLAAISQPQKSDATVLAVEYADFGWLARQYKAKGYVTEAEHGALILRQVAQTLFKLCVTHETLSLAGKQKHLVYIQSLSAHHRDDLGQFMKQYYGVLFRPNRIQATLAPLLPEQTLDRRALQTALDEGTMQALLATEHPVARLVADLCDSFTLDPDPYQSLSEQFAELSQLLADIQIETLHILVDRIDEVPALADNYEAQADILEPLLAYLHLLERPNVGFKFFLSQELCGVLENRPKIRRDRLFNKQIEIIWTQDLLQQILDARVNFFSDSYYSEFTQLCDETHGTTIQKDMLKLSQGSPRRLLHTGNALLQTLFEHSQDKDLRLISNKDWEVAKHKLLQLMPPVLQISLQQRKIFSGAEIIKLTPTEKKILEALIDQDGYIERETLADQVWEKAVTDAGIDQAIKRLREKLGDTGSQPVYLQTLRKQGFRLQHYQAIDS